MMVMLLSVYIWITIFPANPPLLFIQPFFTDPPRGPPLALPHMQTESALRMRIKPSSFAAAYWKNRENHLPQTLCLCVVPCGR